MNDYDKVYWMAVIGALCISIPYSCVVFAAIEYFMRIGDYRSLMLFGGGGLSLFPLYYFSILKGLRGIAEARRLEK